ncbi:MAG: phosphodiesterase [Rhodospirillales bacterium]|jgi:Icc protein|nr:phosphodiesterase [Rhodospirillales bacterium]
MIIAQITDLHACAPGRFCNHVVDTNAMLAAAVEALLALRPLPDVVLATGDLVESGSAEEYAVLRQALTPLAMPVYLIPGNHDRRAELRAAFPDASYWPAGEKLCYVVDDHPVRLIALDTLVEGSGEGEIGAAQLEWLAAALADAPARPTVIFMHHPPFATAIGHMDRINCRDGAALAAIVARHPQVERVLCGHDHRPIQTRFAGTIGSVAPSTAHQMLLDLRPGALSGFVLEPPGLHVHHWAADTGVVTHQAAIGRYPGPFPFVG